MGLALLTQAAEPLLFPTKPPSAPEASVPALESRVTDTKGALEVLAKLDPMAAASPEDVAAVRNILKLVQEGTLSRPADYVDFGLAGGYLNSYEFQLCYSVLTLSGVFEPLVANALAVFAHVEKEYLKGRVKMGMPEFLDHLASWASREPSPMMREMSRLYIALAGGSRQHADNAITALAKMGCLLGESPYTAKPVTIAANPAALPQFNVKATTFDWEKLCLIWRSRLLSLSSSITTTAADNILGGQTLVTPPTEFQKVAQRFINAAAATA